MVLGPLFSARTFQVSDGENYRHSFVPSLSVQVPQGTEIQVWRTDDIVQLLQFALLAATAANDIRDALRSLDLLESP